MPLAIVNADDLGYDPAVTRGILESMREGLVTSATFLVNTPHSAAAAEAARGLALGLHLNLARGRPVGPRFPAALLKGGALDEARAAALPADVVETEAHAQVERFEALCGRPPTHVDVHKHLHRHPAVLEGLAAAALAYGLPVRSVSPEMRARLRALGVPTNAHFFGDAGAEAYWTLAQLEEVLAALPAEGTSELMCHPGYAPETLRSGYAAQREVELRTFTAPEAHALFERHGVQRVDFRALLTPVRA